MAKERGAVVGDERKRTPWGRERRKRKKEKIKEKIITYKYCIP